MKSTRVGSAVQTPEKFLEVIRLPDIQNRIMGAIQSDGSFADELASFDLLDDAPDIIDKRPQAFPRIVRAADKSCGETGFAPPFSCDAYSTRDFRGDVRSVRMNFDGSTGAHTPQGL